MKEHESNSEYIRCRNCGRHVEKNHSIKEIFCSENCAAVFTRCPNCGKFFPEINKDRHKGFCSLECETVYGEDGIIISTETDPDKVEVSEENQ